MTDNRNIENSGRLITLDYLRGFAAISVVLFHFTFGYDNGLGILSNRKFYFTYGNLGVQLFFMISGFVILMTLDKTKKSMDFLVSRFSRLYPAYWSAIIITVIFVLSIPSPFNFDNLNCIQVFANLTMFQHWFKIKDIDGAYWTLSVELTFYFIMWLIFVSNTLQNIEGYCICWMILLFFSLYLDIPFENYLNQIFILPHCPLFIAGINYYLIKKGGSPLNYFIIISSFILEILILKQNKVSFYPSLAIIFIFYMVFYLFIKNILAFRYNKLLSFLGSISYTLYLIHENIGLTIIFWIKKIYNFQLFYIPITLLIVIGIAYLLSNCVERPIMKLIKNKYYYFNLISK